MIYLIKSKLYVFDTIVIKDIGKYNSGQLLTNINLH